MSQRYLQQISEYGPWRGIWNGQGAPSGSVSDMCNLQIVDGKLCNRPGIVDLRGTNFDARSIYPLSITMFKPSSGLPVVSSAGTEPSKTKKILIAAASSASFFIYSTENPSRNAAYTQVNDTSIKITNYSHLSCIQTIRRYEDSDGNGQYMDVVVYVDKSNRTWYWSPCEAGNGLAYGVNYLDSIDGGDSSTTYLYEPPTGKYVTKFKDRLFIANSKDGPNRIYFSGSHESGTFPCNVWPSSYNIDIGDSSEITGVVSTDDVLYLFKQNSIYSLSGDGVAGIWDIQVITESAGAIPGFTCVETPGGIFFTGVDGVYKLSSSGVENISRSRLGSVWGLVNTNYPNPYTVFDKKNNRVLFFLGSKKQMSADGGPDICIVYDIENDAIYRWGWFLEGYTSTNYFMPYRCEYLDDFNCVFGARANSRRACMILDKTPLDTRYNGSSYVDIGIPWFLKTHNLIPSDYEEKIIRNLFVDFQETGDWYITIAAFVDDLHPIVYSEKNDKFARIVDHTSSTDHKLDRTNPFVAGDIVDVYADMSLVKLVDSSTIGSLTGLGADVVKLGSSFNSNNLTGIPLYVIANEDSVPSKNLICYTDAKTILGNASCVFPYETGATANTSAFSLIGDQTKKKFSGIRASGKGLSLYITNIGTEGTASSPCAVKTGMRVKIAGFGVFVIPLGTKRI